MSKKHINKEVTDLLVFTRDYPQKNNPFPENMVEKYFRLGAALNLKELANITPIAR